MTEPVGERGPRLRERLGWRAERRPEPGFAHSLGAGAAAFVVFAVVALIIEIGDDDLSVPGALFFLFLAAVSIVVGAQYPGPLRTAAVTALVFSVPAVWGFAFAGDGDLGSGALRGIYILTAVTYALLYLVTWAKGRAILLGLFLLVTWAWITSEVSGLDKSGLPFQSIVERESETDLGSGQANPDFHVDENGELVFEEDSGYSFDDSGNVTYDDNATESSITSIIIGLLFLGAAFRLDRKGFAGAATPFLVVGAIAAISGAIALGIAEETLLGGGLLVAAAGAAVGFVGGQGMDRRGSTWFGVIVVVLGFVPIVIDVVTGDDFEGGTALGYAAAFAIVALLLGAAAWFAAPRFKEYVDGDVNAPRTGEGQPASPVV